MIHKPTLLAPIILGCDGPTEHKSSFLDHILQPIAQAQTHPTSKRQRYHKVYQLCRKEEVPKSAILVSVDGCQQCLLTRVLRLAIISCFTKGVPCVCGTVGARESTTYCCPWVPGTSFSLTCLKSECPAQARMGGGRGFK